MKKDAKLVTFTVLLLTKRLGPSTVLCFISEPYDLAVLFNFFIDNIYCLKGLDVVK